MVNLPLGGVGPLALHHPLTAATCGATPLVRGKYVRVTHVRAFLSKGTFLRGNICPGEHLSGYVSSGLVKCRGDPPYG